MGKRGMSHIEVILSFIIFITAVGFALYFFSPNSERLIDSVLTYSFREITDTATTKLESYSIAINTTAVSEDEAVLGTSISIIGIEIVGINTGLNASALSEDGKTLDSERSGDIVYIHAGSDGSWSIIPFVRIEFNEEFEHDAVLGIHDPRYYEISSSRERDIISERRFLELKASYEQDYSVLKSSFNLPNRVDFGFSLVFSDDDALIAERDIPQGIEVFSETKRVEVLRTHGERAFADLTVVVW